ncbi:phosphoribosylformylglycinamidine synthase subunit PurQ [Hyphomicrobiales bacterium]|jgi:phosphoribosylformylglycinamidine synthase|nr:phosphoribosylformylglycinamidine synthase subunit PurQ [Rhodobiaceae bacterium]MBT5640578.1 phosphoribosylformylglycinamidine synthase subunit PurQ [Rhodobiaceae bacterium]MBT6223172.1 phosphoribosylformylglycinamidine synthase subunit PurQ [Rhodobiaceae bacterium]MDC0139278.1 phosphoribosylformylglycinamidine synthase subunit PurQ [Hyphomicrobiales bacterium]
MDVSLIIFPGANCDKDTSLAIKHITGKHPKHVWYKETTLPKSDLVILPGGFSHGDYLRSGAIAAKAPIIKDLIKKSADGIYVLGICNGFQILTECGLLQGSLIKNNSLKFVSRNVRLRVIRNDTIFTSNFKENEDVNMPIAHHDGNFYIDDNSLKKIEEEGRVAFRYIENNAKHSPYNPNGSLNDIAGVYNDNFKILGLMPHPERAIDKITGGDHGAKIFESMFHSLSQ